MQLLRRRIDEIPTRAELVQYERRFVELYEQVKEIANVKRSLVTAWTGGS